MVFAGIGLALAYWWFAWPRIIGWIFRTRIEHQPWKWLVTRAQRNVGWLIFASTAAIAGALYGVLDATSVYQSKTQLQLIAIGAAVAVTFVYGALLPPKVSLSMHRVVDLNTGGYDDTHRYEIRAHAGEVTPVFLIAFNVGIATWTSFRVTLNAGDGFLLSAKHQTFPNAAEWAWGGGTWRQISASVLMGHRSEPLAAGEPQVARIFLELPSGAADGELRVVIASAGHFGETTSTLPIRVC
jgi:hypothetical protein